MLLVKGTLLYDPVREGLKRTDQSHTLILDLPCEDLAEYYQWFIKKQYGEKFKLQSPMFGTHVTVVRPQEVDLTNENWLKYQGEELTVAYSPENFERHWEFWSLSIFSTDLVNIRRELDLRTDFRLHMTIGRQFDWQHRPLLEGVIQDTDYLDYEPNFQLKRTSKHKM